MKNKNDDFEMAKGLFKYLSLQMKYKNINKMEEQTLLMPKGTEVERVEIDGNKVVITFKDKDVFVPKDGDVLVSFFNNGSEACGWISIFKKGDVHSYSTHALYFVPFMCRGIQNARFSGHIVFDNDSCESQTDTCKATEAESAELFTAMEKAGYKWNADEKRVEKIRWRAKKGEKFWTCSYCEVDGVGLFVPTELMDSGSSAFDKLYTNGDYHFLRKDCQKLCDQLNTTVKNFKP